MHLLRVAYNIKRGGTKFSFKPNVLAVYHLGEDSYENIFSKRQILTGSNGLTLNANIIGKYALTAKSSFRTVCCSTVLWLKNTSR